MQKVRKFLQEIPIDDEEIDSLFENGFESFEFINSATKEDLLSINIKLGHAIQIIKKCKDQEDCLETETPKDSCLTDSETQEEEEDNIKTALKRKRGIPKKQTQENNEEENGKKETFVKKRVRPKKQKNEEQVIDQIDQKETPLKKEKIEEKDTPLKQEMETKNVFILLTISTTDHSVSFKVKRETKIGIVFEKYCNHVGVKLFDVRFRYNSCFLNTCLNKTPNELGMVDNDIIDAMIQQTGGKPVIMVYSNERKDIDLSISLSKDWKFDQVYPNDILRNDYELTWKIVTQKDGMIEYEQKEYPYLFYDLKIIKDDMFQFKNYFCIPKNEVLNFLEDSLTRLGLNRREMTDFITYWIHQVLDKDYTIIEFLDQRVYDKVSTLKIQPSPDLLIRVFMIFKSVNNKVDNNYDMKYLKNERKQTDLTVIEWGGANIHLNKQFQ